MSDQPKTKRKPKTYALHTPLAPLAAGVLGALAARDNPERPAAHRTIERLVQAELDRLAPGAWDALCAYGPTLPATTKPRDVAAAVAARAAELLRARRPEGSSR